MLQSSTFFGMYQRQMGVDGNGAPTLTKFKLAGRNTTILQSHTSHQMMGKDTFPVQTVSKKAVCSHFISSTMSNIKNLLQKYAADF